MPSSAPSLRLESPGAAADATHVAASDGRGGLRFEELPRPRPGAGEMLLHLRAAGLCGTDLFKLAQGTAPEGTVLGHEIVGTVTELGPGVVGFAPGDRVAVPHHVACGRCAFCRRGSEPSCQDYRANQLSPGGFSEWIVVGRPAVERAAFALPLRVSDRAGVFLEPAACVLRGIRQARLPEVAPTGEEPGCVLILGAGAMGLLHLLLLKALHPGLRVALSDPLPERCELALRLGADAATAPGEETEGAGLELSAGRGADAAFDTVGGAELLETALALTRPGGTVVLFAHARPAERAAFDLNRFFKAERRLLGTYSSSLADQREVHRLLCGGRFDPSPLVTHRLPLSRCAEGLALAVERRALKVLFHPAESDPGEEGA